MSKEINGINDVELQPVAPAPVHRKIHLYILRNTTADEKFKIKAYINNDVKYTFNRSEAFDEKVSISPYIYSTEIDLITNNQGHLCVNYQNNLLPIHFYRLCLSRKIPQTDRTFRDYNDEKDRYVGNPSPVAHFFLFDVNFARNFVDGPPGKTLLTFQ
jgi:hypothetical protein